MTWPLLIPVAACGIALYLAFAMWVGELLRMASGCTCHKNGWDPECPVHGRGA